LVRIGHFYFGFTLSYFVVASHGRQEYNVQDYRPGIILVVAWKKINMTQYAVKISLISGQGMGAYDSGGTISAQKSPENDPGSSTRPFFFRLVNETSHPRPLRKTYGGNKASPQIEGLPGSRFASMDSERQRCREDSDRNSNGRS
jgi:hypothetical protein